MSCENGHLEVVQWLVNTFGLTAEDVGSNNNWALHKSYQNGHFEIVKWLKETFDLNIE
jgi:hypothetical protein